MRPYRRLLLVLLAALLLSCGQDLGDDQASPPARVAVEPSALLQLDFDQPLYRAGGWLFNTGEEWPDAVVVESRADVLELVIGSTDHGRALSFPPRCTIASCARALVELTDDDRLDPKEQDFVFGARVRLAADETDIGSNVVQKGRYESPGGQWKLQVDGSDGHPSCVLQGEVDGERESVKLEASRSVADDAWHLVTCGLEGNLLTITVDEDIKTVEAEVGTISNAEPMRIGASGPKSSDDQFHGDIDDVHFCLGECV